jgi:hypothetical protein
MNNSDYDTLEKTRRAAILTAANLLETAAKAKRLRKRLVSTLGTDDSTKDDKKDFLFDLLRLNANYMNQLATLGKRHGSIAQSALEKLYDLMVPPGRRDSTSEIAFTRDHRVAPFHIRNDASPDIRTATIEPRGFVPSETGKWLKSLTASGVDVPVDDQGPGEVYVVPAPFGQVTELVAEVYASISGHRQYTPELRVTLGDVVRTIPVHIDWRAKNP